MRLLYLDWPHLPLRLELAHHPVAAELIVLGGQPWEPGTVLDCSPAARKLGVQRGQSLGTAHKLVPEALFLTPDPPAYTRAFEQALHALGELAPAIEGVTDPTAPAFGQAFVGIEGLDRLWGDEPTLVGRAIALTAQLPGRPRAGIGNTRFGAQVAAVSGARDGTAFGGIPVGSASVEAAWLAPLPIRLLPAEPEIRDRFRLFGLTRIGELAALDRSAVVARFGEHGGELHDLSRGLDGRPLRPRRPVERLHADVELDPPVDSLEPLRFVLRHLCGALCEQLAARGAGAARAALVLELERAPAVRYEQALPESAAHPDLLERLLVARLEAAPPQTLVERLRLELDGTAPAAGQQLGLFTPQLARASRLDWQLAGLVIRYGSGRLLQANLRDPEARLAEERFEWRPAALGALGTSP
jgi:nucleotidyltransferase/DNA polymerase involved in DNA repair